jgi:hypothetical protein
VDELKLRHCGLMVKNMRRAADWYRNKLGFEISIPRQVEEWNGEEIETMKLELIKGNWKPHVAIDFNMVHYKWDNAQKCLVIIVEDSEGNPVELLFWPKEE